MNIIESYSIETSFGLILNFLYVNPEPEFITLTSLKLFLLLVLKIWIPLEVSVNPIVLIPAKASPVVAWSLIVVGLIIFTAYSSPLAKLPVVVLVGSPGSPTANGVLPFWL